MISELKVPFRRESEIEHAAQCRQTADRFQVTCSRCVRLIWPERVRRRAPWALQ